MFTQNLTKLSDKELIELEKKIAEEKEARKTSLMYKRNLEIGHERFEKMSALLNRYIREKGGHTDIKNALHHPVHKIQGDVFNICDYVHGNFTVKERKGISEEVLRCDGARLLMDDKEAYKAMYDELYSVIDKWVDKMSIVSSWSYAATISEEMEETENE